MPRPPRSRPSEAECYESWGWRDRLSYLQNVQRDTYTMLWVRWECGAVAIRLLGLRWESANGNACHGYGRDTATSVLVSLPETCSRLCGKGNRCKAASAVFSGLQQECQRRVCLDYGG